MQYLTPGVYVEEISTLPPSVVEVATAIPAFMGYTQTAKDENGNDLSGLVVKRIDSFKEYTDLFGGPEPAPFDIAVDGDGNITSATRRLSDGTTAAGLLPPYMMYYSLKLYFNNGGGTCYIVSVGRYTDSIAKPDFEDGLAALKKEDEPTLIILVDAVHLTDDYLPLCQQVLSQCGELKDRFGIFDVLDGDTDATNFRQGIGNSNLKYGGAYTPYVKTALSHQYSEDEVNITGYKYGNTSDDGLLIIYRGSVATPQAVFVSAGTELDFSIDDTSGALTISGLTAEGQSTTDILTAWAKLAAEDQGDYGLFQAGDGKATILETTVDVDQDATLLTIQNAYTQLYNRIIAELSRQRVVLPPSAAIAGVYARVDRNRGVWKAPANESLLSVLEPHERYDNIQQGRLNIDPTGGKSINAIRSFAGRGILVWGARTLAGNDNEWRYINVRRLFNLIEESIQKSTAFVVFEPNDTTTWLKVKALIESYLYGLWQQGALAGPSPEAAYFVNVGLGKTMTTQDILEGRLIVEIGVAAVRPAEFIILRFFHKLQEA